MNIEKILDDPFVQERVNPLLLKEIGKYAQVAKSLEKGDQIQNSLTLFLFRKLLQPLYLEYAPSQKGTVFFLSTISSDGIGDFIALNKCAQLFKENCPEYDVKLGYTLQRSLPHWPNPLESYVFNDPDYVIEKIVEGLALPDYPKELKAVQDELAKNADDYSIIKAKSPIAAEAIEEYHLELQDREKKIKRGVALKERGVIFYQELLTSKAIVNVSLAFNTFGNPLLANKSLYFSETGNFQGIGHAEQLNWYSMGLLPFEEGIFLKQESPTNQGKQYLSYITSLSQAKLCFIYLACELQPSTDIEIVLFPLTDDEIGQLDLAHLGKLGIAKIKIDSREITTGIRTGKTLILRQELPMAYDSFIELMRKSPSPIGCTGDLSLSEVISLGKIPFYEMRAHKTETVEVLNTIALFLHLDEVNSYLTHLMELEAPSQTASALARLIQSPSFEKQWQTLLSFIKRYYCFENSFLATMKAFFAYQEKQGWKKEEQKILLGDQSAKEIFLEISKRLASFIPLS